MSKCLQNENLSFLFSCNSFNSVFLVLFFKMKIVMDALEKVFEFGHCTRGLACEAVETAVGIEEKLWDTVGDLMWWRRSYPFNVDNSTTIYFRVTAL